MSKYKVGFYVNSNANIYSTNAEVIDLVDDYGYTEKEAEEIVIKKFLPHLIEVILEEIDEVKTYRTDRIEFRLDKINGKWEITSEN